MPGPLNCCERGSRARAGRRPKRARIARARDQRARKHQENRLPALFEVRTNRWVDDLQNRTPRCADQMVVGT